MNRRDPKSGKPSPRRASRFIGFPNLNHLYYFHVVAQEGSLKQTCAILGVTRPTISAQIKSLEEFVGVRLFRREVGGMRLSAAGQRMFEHTSVMFQATEMMLRGFAQESARGAPNIEMAVAAPVMHALPAEHFLAILEPAEVFMRLRHGDHQLLQADLLAGEIDILLTDIAPDANDDHRLASQIVHQPKLVGVYSSIRQLTESFPLCLEEVGLFHYSVGSKYRWEIDRYLHEHGVAPQVVAESDNAQVMLKAAERGMSAAIVPDNIAEVGIDAGRLQNLGEVTGLRTEIYALHLKQPRQEILDAIETLRRETGQTHGPSGKAGGTRHRQVRSTEGFTVHTTLPPTDDE